MILASPCHILRRSLGAYEFIWLRWFTSPDCRKLLFMWPASQHRLIDTWHHFMSPSGTTFALAVRSDYKPSYILEQEWEAKQKACETFSWLNNKNSREGGRCKLGFSCWILRVWCTVNFSVAICVKGFPNILYHSRSLRRPLKPKEERDGRRRWKGIVKLVKGSCSCWVLLLVVGREPRSWYCKL